MDIFELMKARHSVRQYTEQKIEENKRKILNDLAKELNSKSGLNIQILYDEPNCFNSMLARYGKFSGCSNYIAIVGKKSNELEEKAGYYGEQLVLKAQEIGLNTCWVAMTHGKSLAKINKGEKLVILISLGYGANQGVEHKSKALSLVCNCAENMPEEFEKGIKAALLAPTAMNKQKFMFNLENDKVSLVSKGGFYSKIDLGIVKYHFEAVSGYQLN